MRAVVLRNELLHRVRTGLLALALVAFPVLCAADTFVSVAIAPPALPVYAQPPIPGPGYLWTPGYWAYGPFGYYWVPGTWVLPPAVGLLWTPGYWGWSGGAYLWHGGYWGPRVGYYGGVNYGFGYIGTGYHGGYWRGGAFYYNRAVNNVNVNSIHTTYNRTVNVNTVNHVSYNGGPGGVRAQPTAAERQAMGERHVEATPMQLQHQSAASENRALFASENHGRPAIAATPQPGAFGQQGVTPARENPARNAANRTTGAATPGAAGGSTAGADAKHARNRAAEGTQGLPSPQAQGNPNRANGNARHPATADTTLPGTKPPRAQMNAAGKPQGHPQGHPQAAAPGGAYASGAAPRGGQPHPQGEPQGHAKGASEPRGEMQRH